MRYAIIALHKAVRHILCYICIFLSRDKGTQLHQKKKALSAKMFAKTADKKH